MIGYSGATSNPSNNHGARRECDSPDLVVLHYTAMETDQEALERLCSSDHKVSAHYLISASGEIFQLVAEDRRAWHAGLSYWAGQRDVNSRSIGIELDNNGSAPFPYPQSRALVALCQDILQRWSIPTWRVVAHSDIAIGRKIDPGPIFDWYGLAKENIGIWPALGQVALGTDEAQFLEDAAIYGYETTLGLKLVLSAFRLHFRPMAQGPLDPIDCALVHGLKDYLPLTRLTEPLNRKERGELDGRGP
jgi:N-acetylmuramoyl-L-alanine amidase